MPLYEADVNNNVHTFNINDEALIDPKSYELFYKAIFTLDASVNASKSQLIINIDETSSPELLQKIKNVLNSCVNFTNIQINTINSPHNSVQQEFKKSISEIEARNLLYHSRFSHLLSQIKDFVTQEKKDDPIEQRFIKRQEVIWKTLWREIYTNLAHSNHFGSATISCLTGNGINDLEVFDPLEYANHNNSSNQVNTLNQKICAMGILGLEQSLRYLFSNAYEQQKNANQSDSTTPFLLARKILLLAEENLSLLDLIKTINSIQAEIIAKQRNEPTNNQFVLPCIELNLSSFDNAMDREDVALLLNELKILIQNNPHLSYVELGNRFLFGHRPSKENLNSNDPVYKALTEIQQTHFKGTVRFPALEDFYHFSARGFFEDMQLRQRRKEHLEGRPSLAPRFMIETKPFTEGLDIPPAWENIFTEDESEEANIEITLNQELEQTQETTLEQETTLLAAHLQHLKNINNNRSQNSHLAIVIPNNQLIGYGRTNEEIFQKNEAFLDMRSFFPRPHCPHTLPLDIYTNIISQDSNGIHDVSERAMRQIGSYADYFIGSVADEEHFLPQGFYFASDEKGRKVLDYDASNVRKIPDDIKGLISVLQTCRNRFIAEGTKSLQFKKNPAKVSDYLKLKRDDIIDTLTQECEGIFDLFNQFYPGQISLDGKNQDEIIFKMQAICTNYDEWINTFVPKGKFFVNALKEVLLAKGLKGLDDYLQTIKSFHAWSMSYDGAESFNIFCENYLNKFENQIELSHISEIGILEKIKHLNPIHLSWWNRLNHNQATSFCRLLPSESFGAFETFLNKIQSYGITLPPNPQLKGSTQIQVALCNIIASLESAADKQNQLDQFADGSLSLAPKGEAALAKAAGLNFTCPEMKLNDIKNSNEIITDSKDFIEIVNTALDLFNEDNNANFNHFKVLAYRYIAAQPYYLPLSILHEVFDIVDNCKLITEKVLLINLIAITTTQSNIGNYDAPSLFKQIKDLISDIDSVNVIAITEFLNETLIRKATPSIEDAITLINYLKNHSSDNQKSLEIPMGLLAVRGASVLPFIMARLKTNKFFDSNNNYLFTELDNLSLLKKRFNLEEKYLTTLGSFQIDINPLTVSDLHEEVLKLLITVINQCDITETYKKRSSLISLQDLFEHFIKISDNNQISFESVANELRNTFNISIPTSTVVAHSIKRDCIELMKAMGAIDSPTHANKFFGDLQLSYNEKMSLFHNQEAISSARLNLQNKIENMSTATLYDVIHAICETKLSDSLKIVLSKIIFNHQKNLFTEKNKVMLNKYFPNNKELSDELANNLANSVYGHFDFNGLNDFSFSSIEQRRLDYNSLIKLLQSRPKLANACFTRLHHEPSVHIQTLTDLTHLLKLTLHEDAMIHLLQQTYINSSPIINKEVDFRVISNYFSAIPHSLLKDKDIAAWIKLADNDAELLFSLVNLIANSSITKLKTVSNQLNELKNSNVAFKNLIQLLNSKKVVSGFTTQLEAEPLIQLLSDIQLHHPDFYSNHLNSLMPFLVNMDIENVNKNIMFLAKSPDLLISATTQQIIELIKSDNIQQTRSNIFINRNKRREEVVADKPDYTQAFNMLTENFSISAKQYHELNKFLKEIDDKSNHYANRPTATLVKRLTHLKDKSSSLNQKPDSEHKQSIAEVLAILRELHYRYCFNDKKEGIYPNSTQMLGLLYCNLYNQDYNALGMATGEGKSTVITLQAAMSWLTNHTVDIATTSQTLATRDFSKTKDFFNAMGASTTLIDQETSLKNYQANQIHFSTAQNLSFLHMRQANSQINRISKFELNLHLLLDEFDTTALDKSPEFVLPSDQQNHKAGNPHIWCYTHINTFVDYLDKKLTVDSETEKQILACLNSNHHDKKLSRADQVRALYTYLKSLEPKDKPSTLTGPDLHELLNRWICGSRKARNHAESSRPKWQLGLNNEGKLIAYILGTDKYPMFQARYGDSVQQLLHDRISKRSDLIKLCTKHNIKISENHEFVYEPETQALSKTNNREFLRYYQIHGKITGYTGSLGDQREIQELFKEFNIAANSISRHKADNRTFHKPKMTNNYNEQAKEIIKVIKANKKSKNPILVLCPDPGMLQALVSELAKLNKYSGDINALNGQEINGYKFNILQPTDLLNPATKDKAEEKFLEDAKNPNVLSISTLAERGTNIQPKQGTLEVIITSIDNARGEIQKPGRTGRQGAKGDVHYIYNKQEIKERHKIDYQDKMPVKKLIKLIQEKMSKQEADQRHEQYLRNEITHAFQRQFKEWKRELVLNSANQAIQIKFKKFQVDTLQKLHDTNLEIYSELGDKSTTATKIYKLQQAAEKIWLESQQNFNVIASKNGHFEPMTLTQKLHQRQTKRLRHKQRNLPAYGNSLTEEKKSSLVKNNKNYLKNWWIADDRKISWEKVDKALKQTDIITTQNTINSVILESLEFDHERSGSFLFARKYDSRLRNHFFAQKQQFYKDSLHTTDTDQLLLNELQFVKAYCNSAMKFDFQNKGFFSFVSNLLANINFETLVIDNDTYKMLLNKSTEILRLVDNNQKMTGQTNFTAVFESLNVLVDNFKTQHESGLLVTNLTLDQNDLLRETESPRAVEYVLTLSSMVKDIAQSIEKYQSNFTKRHDWFNQSTKVAVEGFVKTHPNFEIKAISNNSFEQLNICQQFQKMIQVLTTHNALNYNLRSNNGIIYLTCDIYDKLLATHVTTEFQFQYHKNLHLLEFTNHYASVAEQGLVLGL